MGGSTSSGKSTFIAKLIKNKNDLIWPRINRIIYCYSEYKPALAFPSITTYSRGYSEDLISSNKLGDNDQTLLVLDDLIEEVQVR